MIQPTAKKLEQALSDVDGTIRRLARGLRGIPDFKPFFKSLQDTFEWLSTVSGRSIRLALPGQDEQEPDELFSGPELALPVATTSDRSGYIRVAPPAASRPFGPQDLHLLGTLAEFTGALLDVSGRIRADREIIDRLRTVYDQLPIGILCFDQDGEVVVANARVPVIDHPEQWRNRDGAMGYLEEQGTRQETDDPDRLQYLMLFGVRQLLVDIRRVNVSGTEACTVVTFADLTSGAGTLQDALAREIYRCRWLDRPLTLLVASTDSDLGPLLSGFAELREKLGGDAVFDLIEGSAVGLIAPDRVPREALRSARSAGVLSALTSLNLGWSALGDDGGKPEDLMAGALASLRPATGLMRPRLLAFDAYPAIVDMVEMVVRDHFQVDKTTDPERALRLMEASPYDGLVTECEPEESEAGPRLLTAARELQPGIRTVVTTTRFGLKADGDPVPSGARIVTKPFTVEGLRASLDEMIDV